MTVLDILSYATEITGDISSEAQDFARRALRIKYGTLYNSHCWRESQRTLDAFLMDPTLNGSVFLPFDADEVISLAMSYDGLAYVRLIYHERDWIERFSTPAFNLPNNTPWFYRGENYAWPIQNPGQLTISTNEPSPFRFFVGGVDLNNNPVTDDMNLQGVNNPDGTVNTTFTTTTGVYHRITSLSKGVTQTPVRVTDSLGNAYVMPGGSTELSFTQLILYPPPTFLAPDNTSKPVYLRVLAKLKADPLTSDMSVPRISHIWEALISFTKGACYERMSQVAKATQATQDGMDYIRAAIQIEKNQSEFHQQAVPQVYERGNYLFDGGLFYGYANSSNPFGL